MRLVWLVALAASCGAPPRATPVTAPPAVASGLPRLPPPPVIDLDAPGAPYRAAVALQLQPLWAQFLEDCRVRLAASDPLNAMTLGATADIAVDGSGRIVAVALSSSGNADFDRAVRQVIRDAAPLPRPPADLLSDDDRVHLRWLFARDRRQAGPATGALVEKRLPIRTVTERFVGSGDLTRAARRIRREPSGGDRTPAIERLMLGALEAGLASSDAAVRVAAIEAIGAARLERFAPAIAKLVESADVDVRFAAIRAAGLLGDEALAGAIRARLPSDLSTSERFAVAEAEALVALGFGAEVVALVGERLTRAPDIIALRVASVVNVPALANLLPAWSRSRDARVREAVCGAARHAPVATARAITRRGHRDRDVAVRSACTAAQARLPTTLDELRPYLDDRDADVRAAAWRTAVERMRVDAAPGAARAMLDPSPLVRRAAVQLVADGDALLRLASSDDDAVVRTEALVAYARTVGRAASTEVLLDRFVESPGVERVRVALAWHLAR